MNDNYIIARNLLLGDTIIDNLKKDEDYIDLDERDTYEKWIN